MATTHAVDAAGTLGSFLKTREQPWRIPIFLANGAITIKRAGTSTAATSLAVTVAKGDVVEIDQSKVWKDLTALATKDSEDLMFAPGITPYEIQMAKTLSNRPQMRQIGSNGGDPKSLTEFLAALIPEATKPIRNIYLIAHGSMQGNLEFPQRPRRVPPPTPAAGEPKAQDDHVIWEGLLEAKQDESMFIGKTTFVTLPRPEKNGQPLVSGIHIKGCRIGMHVRWLEKFKEALGRFSGPHSVGVVTAPKFFAGSANFNLSQTKTKVPDGVIEFMMHEFTLLRPVPFQTRADLLSAFNAEGFTEHDGGTITRVRWDKWIPKKIHTTPKPNNTELEVMELTYPIKTKPMTAKMQVQYEYQTTNELNGTLPLPAAPKTEEDALKGLISELPKRRNYFKSSHAFPMFERLGYENTDQCVRGYSFEDPKWKSGEPRWYERNWKASTNELTFEGIRHIYTVRTPLTTGSGSPRNLLINFWPTSAKHAALQTVMIKEDDANLFGIA